MRRSAGETPPLAAAEQAACAALRTEFDKLQETYASDDELPEEVDARLGEIETALEAFDERPAVYDPAATANAGVFVSIDADGDLRVERGYVRPEHEAASVAEPNRESAEAAGRSAAPCTVIMVGGTAAEGDFSKKKRARALGSSPIAGRRPPYRTWWRGRSTCAAAGIAAAPAASCRKWRR
jgi:ParB family transcriptional regulator, chromosome partitioning protein